MRNMYRNPLKFICSKTQEIFPVMLRSFYYIPTLFIAFILITPVNIIITSNADGVDPNISFTFYQVLVLIFVALPTLSLYISSEVDEFMKQDYILSSQLLGASRFHIIKNTYESYYLTAYLYYLWNISSKHSYSLSI